MRNAAFVLVLGLLFAQWSAAQSITLGSQGTLPDSLQNATLNNDVSTTTPILNSTAVGLIWNGVVSWSATPSTGTQSEQRTHFLEFNVNSPTQISNVTCVAVYQWVNGGGTGSNPVSNSFGQAQVLQYTDSNNNGHFDPSEPTTTIATVNVPTLTVTGTGSASQAVGRTDVSSYTLAANTHYILAAELLDTSTFTSPNTSGPTTSYTADLSSPNFDGIQVAFNYTAIPEPAGLVWIATGCLALLRHGRRVDSDVLRLEPFASRLTATPIRLYKKLHVGTFGGGTVARAFAPAD